MTDWSNADMRRLQDDAKKRVMEMRERSKYAVRDAELEAGFADGGAEPYRTPRFIKMPVGLLPRSEFAARGKENEETKARTREETENASGAEKASVPEKKPERREKPPSALIKNIFGELSDDDLERMFILSLCLLLSSERTDEELVIALMYLL